jgi:hypothetical protein
MFRPLSLLVFVIAVACVALFLLLPASRIAHDGNAIIEQPRAEKPPPAVAERQPGADTSSAVTQDKAIVDDSGKRAAPVEKTVPVSGRIGNASGSALAGFDIEVESLGFGGEDIEAQRAKSNQRGEFTLDLVPQRQYKLYVKPAGDYAGHKIEAFTPEKAEALRDIILDQVKLIDIEGMIVDTDHAPIGDFELTLRHMSVIYPDAIIRSDSSGYFALRDFPAGELRIAASNPAYFRIKGLNLHPDEYHNLTLMVDQGSYHLSGWVSDANGAPLEQVQVVLKSGFATDEYQSASHRATMTDANGAFAFSGLGGHRLTLGVYASGFKNHVEVHEFESFSDTLEIVLGQ